MPSVPPQPICWTKEIITVKENGLTEEILGFLKANDVKYTRDEYLSRLSTVKIGGMADFVAYPDSETKLIHLVEFLEEEKIEYKILGRMSNVLPPDDIYRGVIVRTDLMRRVDFQDNIIVAEAGISLPRFSSLCQDMSLSGLEELSGIPGSLGGAIFGNAGAYGREISDLVIDVGAYNIDSKTVVEIPSEMLGFGYRTSAFKASRLVILSARLGLTFGDKDKIQTKIREISTKRRNSQPMGKPSLGSTFKRPSENIYPWRLIDECGLRGFSIGGAAISEKHAGFIVNQGNATSADYFAVASYVKNTVQEKTGVNLEYEFEIL